MLPSRRKKFKIQVPASDQELWAVGAVAVHWSQLEAYIHIHASAFMAPGSDEEKLFKSTRAVDQRLAQWQVLIEREVNDPHRSKIVAIIKQIKEVKYLRDRIMHDTWAGGGDVDEAMSSLFNWFKPRKPLDWNLDFGTIFRVATMIDGVMVDLIASSGLQPDSGLTLTDALQRIRHTPRQIEAHPLRPQNENGIP